uniref:Putative ran-binding protein 3 isoform x1 orussus abietinus n=1 Tax=Xenopsylla cheopis TaxID=163159 RepID=A0A6M2DQ53_XENCH
MSDIPDQSNAVQSPIIMKIDGPEDSSSNENSSETENSTSSTSSSIPTMWVYGSSSSKTTSNNPFVLNNKKTSTLRPSFLRPSQLGSKKEEASSEKSNGPLAPSKLNPFKRNFDDNEIEDNAKETKEKETPTNSKDSDTIKNSNDENVVKNLNTASESNKTNNPSCSGQNRSKSTLVSSFVFGQNVHDRVVTENTVENNEKEDNLSNSTNSATSSNGTSENLFTSLLKKESNEAPQAKENHSVSLTESAKAYEESRANKRKYEEVEVITGEEGERNVIQLCCKLFAFQASIWQDRGRGTMRLNDLEDGDSRLVWRNVGSHRVMLNTLVWEGMTVERASPKSLRITAVDSSAQIKVFLIMAGPTEMDQLQEALTTRVTIAKSKIKSDDGPSPKKISK